MGGGGWEKEMCGEGVLRGDVGSVGWRRQRGARVVEVEGLGRDGGEGEKDPRTENKDGNEKQDGIKMLVIIKKKWFFFACTILHVTYSTQVTTGSHDVFCLSSFASSSLWTPLCDVIEGTIGETISSPLVCPPRFWHLQNTLRVPQSVTARGGS